MNNRTPYLFLIVKLLAGTSLPTQKSNLQTAELINHYRALVNHRMGRAK